MVRIIVTFSQGQSNVLNLVDLAGFDESFTGKIMNGGVTNTEQLQEMLAEYSNLKQGGSSASNNLSESNLEVFIRDFNDHSLFSLRNLVLSIDSLGMNYRTLAKDSVSFSQIEGINRETTIAKVVFELIT